MAFPTRKELVDEYARKVYLPQLIRDAEREMGKDGKRMYEPERSKNYAIEGFKEFILKGKTRPATGNLYKYGQQFENYYAGIIQTELTRQENLYAEEVAQQRALTQEALAKSSAEVAAAQKTFTESQATARAQIEATEAERVKTLAEIETSRAEAEAKIQQATEAAEAMSKRYAAAASAQTQATKSGNIRTQIGSPEQLRTQPKSAKTPVGQPRAARTRLTVGTGVGGYGGTSAGQITPTGLNI